MLHHNHSSDGDWVDKKWIKTRKCIRFFYVTFGSFKDFSLPSQHASALEENAGCKL